MGLVNLRLKVCRGFRAGPTQTGLSSHSLNSDFGSRGIELLISEHKDAVTSDTLFLHLFHRNIRSTSIGRHAGSIFFSLHFFCKPLAQFFWEPLPPIFSSGISTRRWTTRNIR